MLMPSAVFRPADRAEESDVAREQCAASASSSCSFLFLPAPAADAMPCSAPRIFLPGRPYRAVQRIEEVRRACL